MSTSVLIIKIKTCVVCGSQEMYGSDCVCKCTEYLETLQTKGFTRNRDGIRYLFCFDIIKNPTFAKSKTDRMLPVLCLTCISDLLQ